MNGIILVDKPSGWTSFDVVNKLRSTIAHSLGVKAKSIKVGHTGTLDPLATGLLVIAVGSFTKKIPLLVKADKTYQAEVTLGASSSTDDAEGEITPQSIDTQPSKQQILDALHSFVGPIRQVPPQFSAIKIDGKRAYKLARGGQPVEIEPRAVTVHEITEVKVNYPTVSFTLSVSSGTYIRSLARDLGQKLDCGGYLSALRRSQVGQFSVHDAMAMDGVNIERIQKQLVPLDL